jgi:hypothetical protein
MWYCQCQTIATLMTTIASSHDHHYHDQELEFELILHQQQHRGGSQTPIIIVSSSWSNVITITSTNATWRQEGKVAHKREV